MKSNHDAKRWTELDVLRTLAVVLMVLNHTAVRIELGKFTPIVGVTSLVSSMAPVLFFFLTGLGNGVQSIGKEPSRGFHQVVKTAILIAADAFLWVSPSRHIGLDFLAFIGLSALLLKELQRMPRSGTIAAAAAVGLLLMRFVIGPLARPRIAWPPVANLLGLSTSPGFSYPPAPWLVYPLIGYAVGRMAARHRTTFELHRWFVAVVGVFGGLVCGASAVFLVHQGSPIHRWGTVSFAFFLASLNTLGFATAISILLGRLNRSDLVSTGAQESFAIVPLHYVVLAAADAVFGRINGDAAYTFRVMIALALSFFGATLVARATSALRISGGRILDLIWIVVPVACATTLIMLATKSSLSEPSSQFGSALLRSVAQLGLCLLLGLSIPSWSRRSARAEVTSAVSS